MPSVFASAIFVTSELTFEIPGAISVDDRGGAVATKQSVTLEAYLRRRQNLPRLTAADTAVEVATYDLEGRLIDPIVLPIGLTDGAIGTGIVNGESGTVELLPSAREAIAGLESITGQKIRVRFSRRVEVV